MDFPAKKQEEKNLFGILEFFSPFAIHYCFMVRDMNTNVKESV